jgi:hypothetical protein
VKHIYLFQVPVERVDGHQFYRVEASNESEAMAILKSGGGVYDSEELEVVELSIADAELVEIDPIVRIKP